MPRAASDRKITSSVAASSRCARSEGRTIHQSDRISPAEFSQALIEFGTEVVSATALRKIVADNTLVTAALPLIEAHSINATDGIILRSALDLAAQFRAAGDDLVLVASDQRLLRAAQAEGLATFDPESQDQAALDALLSP